MPETSELVSAERMVDKHSELVTIDSARSPSRTRLL